MIYKKTADGERISAVTSEGIALGYIQKARMGTHGHWRGWEHFVFSRKHEAYVPVYAYSELSEPCHFNSIRDFKEYYNMKEDNSHE